MSSKLRLETAIHLLFSFALLAIGIAITALANRGIHNMERYKFMTSIYIPQNPRRPFDFRLQPQNLRRGSSNAILAAGIIGIVAGAAGLVSAIPFGELYHLSFCAITTLLSIGVLVASAVALGLAFDKNGSDKFRMGNQYTIQYSIGQRTHFTIEGWTCQVKDSFAPYQRRRIGFGPICHDMRTSKYLTIPLLVVSVFLAGSAVFAFVKLWKRSRSSKKLQQLQMEQQH